MKNLNLKNLAVLVLVFALLLMTYAMDQRRSNETLGDLTSSVSDLKDSLSGMQTAQSALEENGALKNEIQDLQEQIDTLLGTIDSLTAAGEQQGLAAQGGREAAAYHRAQTRSGQSGAVVGVVLRRTAEEYGRGRIFHG